jgi:hypothetical protein
MIGGGWSNDHGGDHGQWWLSVVVVELVIKSGQRLKVVVEAVVGDS